MRADSGMVTVAKSLGTAGMVLAILNVLLQIAGIATKHSNSALNKVCFGLCILCGLCMMIAGMWCNQYVLYARQGRHDNGSLLVVESSGPGLLLLCVVTSAVNVVFLHVVSHGPGPVSTQTRFLYKVPADEIEGKESATAQAEAAHRLIAEAPPEDDPEASSAV
ncbi:hypothetical protein BaRGS_00017305 [Batillaria attramentaria]|uniref:Transmembrane protein n=1 Tax=Batillaria attramentaria TaxID=370345 RepID=A0ABD0KWN8_9CAEN